VLVVVGQDPFSQIDGDLHVLLEVCKVLTTGMVASERRRLDLRRAALSATPTAFVDVLDRIVVVEHRARFDAQDAFDDLPRDSPITLGLNWHGRRRRLGQRVTLGLFIQQVEQVLLTGLGFDHGDFSDRRRSLFHDQSGFEIGVCFLVSTPGICQGSTREDDCSDNCSSHGAGSFHRVTKVVEGCG
jgi:hypothetical protein